MLYPDEPEWMQKARTVPLRSDWESRQPNHRPVYQRAPRAFGTDPATLYTEAQPDLS